MIEDLRGGGPDGNGSGPRIDEGNNPFELRDIGEIRIRLVKLMSEVKFKSGEKASLGQEFNRRIGQHIADDVEIENLKIPVGYIKVVPPGFEGLEEADSRLKIFFNKVFNALRRNGVDTVGKLRNLDLSEEGPSVRGVGKVYSKFLALAFCRPQMAAQGDKVIVSTEELQDPTGINKKIKVELVKALSRTDLNSRLFSDYASTVNEMVGKNIPDDIRINDLILPIYADRLAVREFKRYGKIDSSLKREFNSILRAFVRYNESMTVGDVRGLKDISNVPSLAPMGWKGFNAIKTALALSSNPDSSSS